MSLPMVAMWSGVRMWVECGREVVGSSGVGTWSFLIRMMRESLVCFADVEEDRQTEDGLKSKVTG